MKKKELYKVKSPSKILRKKKKYRSYSYALKRKVVYEIEKGIWNIESARHHYGIKSKSLIYSWIKRYGLLTYDPKKSYQMKQSPQERIKELQLRIEELELEKDLLLDIQEAYEEEGVDVKKYLPEQLKREYSRRKKGEQ